jgi:peptidoglycan hydrolase-like protein with peptidoglycan-binding domain
MQDYTFKGLRKFLDIITEAEAPAGRVDYQANQALDAKTAAVADVKKMASTPMNAIPRFGVAIDPKSGQIFYGDAGNDSGAISPKGYPYKWMQPGGPAESVKDGDRIRASGLEITDKSGYAYIDPAKLATLGQEQAKPDTNPTAPTGQDDNPGLTRFRALINKAQGIQAESVVQESKKYLSLKQIIIESLAEAAFDPAVQKQQQELIAKGAKIKADGIMGPLTQAAIKQFGSTPVDPNKPTLQSAGTMYGPSLTPEEIAEGDKLFQSYADSQDPEIMNLLKQWQQIKNNQLKNIKPDPVNTNPKPPVKPRPPIKPPVKQPETLPDRINSQYKDGSYVGQNGLPSQTPSYEFGAESVDNQLPMLTSEPTIARIVSLANHNR